MVLVEKSPRVAARVTGEFDIPNQIGVTLGRRYDVAKAWSIVNRWSNDKRLRRLMSLRIGKTPPPFTRRAIKKINLSIPVIVAIDRRAPIMIDGLHRQQKAARLGVRELPAFVLTERESKECLWVPR